MKVSVTADDLKAGVIGDCCPILRAIQRALGAPTLNQAKFSQSEWARFAPFTFNIEIQKPSRRQIERWRKQL